MIYRRFGRTELQMPVFSCGGMRYQYKWQDVTPDEISTENQKKLAAIINHSLELGINHIETARAYGTSEMQLGQILPKLDRDQIIVQTKLVPKENPQEFLSNFEKSLSYLGLDYVDLLGLHGINTTEILDSCTREGGYLEVAQKLKAQGKVRFIGFSTHGPTEVIVNAIETNQFDYVNLHWYYINQNNWPAIEAATKHDMGVFIISPTNKGGLLEQPSEKLVKLCDPLSPIVFNNLFCLSHPQVHTLSIGADKPTDFDEHIKTLNYLDKLEEVLPPILHRLQQEMINCLGEEWVKNWHIGLPKPEETPAGINIPAMLWLRNLAIAFDMIEYGKMRYNLFGLGGHWFPGAKVENINDFDFSECLKNSPNADKIPAILAETHSLLAGAEVPRLSQQ
jgi:uncharacterized protein